MLSKLWEYNYYLDAASQLFLYRKKYIEIIYMFAVSIYLERRLTGALRNLIYSVCYVLFLDVSSAIGIGLPPQSHLPVKKLYSIFKLLIRSIHLHTPSSLTIQPPNVNSSP